MPNPTVGRIVWYKDDVNKEHQLAVNGNEPLAAMVVKVLDEKVVNLVVWDANGDSHQKSAVVLREDNEPMPGAYWKWPLVQPSTSAPVVTSSKLVPPLLLQPK